jgi:glutathione S-transferase
MHVDHDGVLINIIEQVELALKEAGAQYKRYEIDLQNKPDWYAPKVNPVSKVPAIAYGGPDVAPDQPSPESTKIAESLVILEFVADLYPTSTLLPKDPVQRAKVRFFIDAVTTKLVLSWFGVVMNGEGPDTLFKAVEDLQALIVKEGGQFAVGNEFTIADAAVLPFLARIEVALKYEVGAFAPGEGPKAWSELAGPKYAKIQAYFEGLKQRKNFKDTWNEVSPCVRTVVEGTSPMFTDNIATGQGRPHQPFRYCSYYASCLRIGCSWEDIEFKAVASKLDEGCKSNK